MDNKRILRKIGFMQGRFSKIERNKIQSFPWKNWKNELEKCKKVNMKIIEWTLDYPWLLKNPLIQDTKKTLSFLKKKRIVLNGVTCDFFMQKPFFKLNTKSKMKDIIHVIKKLKNLNIKLVIPLVDNSSIKNSTDERFVIKTFKRINKKYLYNSKLIICFESDYTPKKLMRFISKFPKSNFGINYDLGNSASLGYNVVDELKLYKGRVYNVHLKDRILNGGNVRFGRGNADFKNFFSNIKKINYKGNFIFQSSRSYSNKHISEMRKNISFMKKFI